MKNTFQTIRLSVLASTLVIALCSSGMAMAEGKTWEIKPNDTLGVVVAKQYSGYANRPAIMQAILKANPDAFIGNNLNRLIVGKVLNLPDASTIPDLKPPVAAGGTADKATLERLKALEADRAEMEETLKLLEEENASLQEMVKNYEEAKQSKDAELAALNTKVKELEASLAASGGKPAPTTAAATEGGGDLATLKGSVDTLQAENTDLKSQLENSKKELADNQRVTEELKTQLADLKRQNETLSNDLQQAHAAASVAESKASSGNWWPWALLGLMALLMLPLLWLLKRNREETLVTTVAAPPKAEPLAKVVAPVSTTAETYSDNTPPPMPVMPVVADTGEREPEDPDAELKLDIARAYLDLRDSTAAADILKEVIAEGGERQKQEAREILSFIA
jgi:FimV-like protein